MKKRKDVGAWYAITLANDGNAIRDARITFLESGFSGDLNKKDSYGSDIDIMSDLNGDCLPEIAVGAPLSDDGGSDKGAVWVQFPTDLLFAKTISADQPSTYSVSNFQIDETFFSRERAALYKLLAYPNPAFDMINVEIKIEHRKEVPVYIELINLLGVRLVHSQQNVSGEFYESLNLQNLPGGQYILRALIGEKLTSHRISVIH